MGWPEPDIAQAAGFIAPPGYQRHRPETTLLYRLVAEHYPIFRDRRAAEERPLPRYVGRLEHGFLRVRCESCQAEKLIARLAALVPKPRAHLGRYHGVLAPASPDRPQVVPGTHAAVSNRAAESSEPSGTDRQRSLTWAQRLKRVFAIDIETCRRCGGQLKVIASIEDPPVIERILEHLGCQSGSADPANPSRAPPRGDLLS